jgi:hypothetical protein
VPAAALRRLYDTHMPVFGPFVVFRRFWSVHSNGGDKTARKLGWVEILKKVLSFGTPVYKVVVNRRFSRCHSALPPEQPPSPHCVQPINGHHTSCTDSTRKYPPISEKISCKFDNRSLMHYYFCLDFLVFTPSFNRRCS